MSKEHLEKQILKSGGFVYELQPDWARIPEKYLAAPISGSCWTDDGLLRISIRMDGVPVITLDKEGCFVEEFAFECFRRGHGIAPTKHGSYLLADDHGHKIYEISNDGYPIRSIGSGCPSDTGYINLIKFLRVGKGMDHHQSADYTIDTVKHGGDPFNRPTQAVEAENGDIYVADGYGNARVHCFDNRGVLKFSFGEPGRGPGQFRLVHGLCLDMNGNLAVADRQNDRIQIFDKNGSFITMMEKMGNRPAEVCSDGTLLYSGGVDGGVAVIDRDYRIVAKLGFSDGNTPGIHAHGICCDREGNLYLSSLTRYEVNLLKLLRI